MRIFIILQSFYSQHFPLLDLVYKIPRSFVFWHDFLNFIVKENMFGLLDDSFEILSILSHLRESVLDQFLIAFLILPYFEVFSDIDIFQKFVSNNIWDSYIFLNNCLKRFFTWYMITYLLSWINSSSIDMSTIKRV